MLKSAAILLLALATASAADIPDRLGVTHVDGRYHLTDRPFLDEGAEVIQQLGSRVIKIYLSLGTDQPSSKLYPFNHDFPAAGSLAELAASPPYRRLFQRPFTTFILSTYRAGKPLNYWREGLTAEDEAAETRQFHDLTAHLLKTYADSGKTFVLQHWEGDWSLLGSYDAKAPLDPQVTGRMIRWLRARQTGVDQARAETKAKAVRVLHAAEVNLVKRGMLHGQPCMTTDVLPHVGVDLVSYSSYESQQDPAMLKRALEFIAEHTPGRSGDGARRVYIGEFGFAENVFSPADLERKTKAAIEAALDWGCPYVVWWQVYCNEPTRPGGKLSGDFRGFWLIRPDGTHGLSYDLLAAFLRRS